MFKIRSTTTQLAAAILASGLFALALGARADAGTDSATCKSARSSAWFERQRQLTDGDFVAGQIATPRECAMTYGANAADQAAPAKQLVATAKAPQQGFPGSNGNAMLGGG